MTDRELLVNLMEVLEMDTNCDWYENDANEEFKLLRNRIAAHLEENSVDQLGKPKEANASRPK